MASVAAKYRKCAAAHLIYVEATLAMKEKALAKPSPPRGRLRLYRPDDQLLPFLNDLSPYQTTSCDPMLSCRSDAGRVNSLPSDPQVARHSPKPYIVCMDGVYAPGLDGKPEFF